MNEPKTPNLGLNKIDRSSPSTTYFDLDKYLDQNWEKVDEGVGKVEEKAEETAAQVSSIQERLDTEKRRSVTLGPGLQVVNAERASAFKLEGLKGRTLVNLLGRDGRCEDVSKWKDYQTSHELDSTNKMIGSSGFKITVLKEFTLGSIYKPESFKAGKYYLFLADVKNGNATGVRINISNGGPTAVNYMDTTNFKTQYVKYNPTEDNAANINISVEGDAGTYGYVDAIRLYEFSATEYAALTNMTAEQIAVKYPYVDSVQPVLNPYAIRYGENLFPTFYEAELASGALVANPYSLSFTLTGSSVNVARFWVPMVEGETYAFAPGLTNGDNFQIIGFADDKTTITMPSLGVVRDTVTFTVPADSGTKYLRLTVISGDFTGTLTVNNPTLTIGNVAKPFKPREDAMLALQTDLFSDPLTGANADEVFEKDGQYFKVKKWQKVDFEGSRITSTILGNKSGFKTLYPKLEGANYGYSSMAASAAVKYDGKILTWGSHEAIADGWAIDKLNNNFAISVPNADSGWGDAYTPTVNEIKAYFMGWTMRNMSASTYNDPTNASQKTWTPIGYSPPANWNSTWAHLRTSVPVNESSPSINDGTISTYQLVYQLATPVVEPITSEGQLTLIEGNNQVEVGTGIVLREGVKPYTFSGNINNINDKTALDFASNFKNKSNRLLTVYVDGLEDLKWTKMSNVTNGNGGGVAQYIGTLDKSKSYSVTYFMLDTFPIAAFVGLVADNEKALLTDLVQDVQQGATSLTVLERSLSEALQSLIQQQNKRNVWGPIS